MYHRNAGTIKRRCAAYFAAVGGVSMMLGAGGPCNTCPDMDDSNSVGVFELLAVLADWHCTAEPGNCPGDVNCDGTVGVPDILELLSNWGDCPPTGTCADTCADAEHATIRHGESHVFTGNNECATPGDCPLLDPVEVGGQGNAWISFTVEETSAVTLSYCGSEGEWSHIWLVLAVDCPCTDTGPLPPPGLPFCVDEWNFEVTWQIVEPGTYYYPVMYDPELGSAGNYTITVSADEPAPMCGADNTNDCCTATTDFTTGCNDEECCMAACAADPWCCDNSFPGVFYWDATCAAWAIEHCAVCEVDCSETAPPPNDECIDAEVITLGDGTLSHTFQGNTFCSSNDCELFNEGQGHVWIAFELTHNSDVSLSYCGSVNDQGGPFGNSWLSLTFDCPCNGFINAANFASSCLDGNVEMTWTNLAAGSYYCTVLWDTANGASGNYNITVAIPDPALSCAGNCAGQAPGGCWCDEGCVERGDCCDNACEVCELETCPDLNSCAGHCFDQAPGGCFCDSACHSWGDCCEDVCEFCPDTDPFTCSLPDQSCAGNCGGQAPSGCWCDDDCMSRGDCCFDACAECPIEACNGSCEGFCGGQSDDGCWCDPGCVEIGNCCPDSCDACGVCPF